MIEAVKQVVEEAGAQADSFSEPRLPAAVLMLGIGGMGMAPLAIYLAQAGVKIFGADDRLQPRVRTLLEAAGVTLLEADEVAAGFAGDRFKDVELCAISSAIHASHRLLVLARSAGLHVVRRGELLAHASRRRRLVAIVGSHGKTTTTGLLIAALERLGLNFDYVLGGLFQDAQCPPARHLPQAQWLVAEVDESDGTIEHFAPYLTLAVNFDWDHTDRYASATALRETFAALFARTATEVIFPADDPVLPALVPPHKARPCEIMPEAKMRGFNGYNESLARCVAKRLLAQPEKTRGGVDAGAVDAPSLFDGFCGIFRRQEWLFRNARLQIMTDYAHHPREVAALLDYLRALNPEGKLVAVFQPHRYTRTRQFAREFAQVLSNRTDAFFLMPVYAASETGFAEGQTEVIASACVRHSGGGFTQQPERMAGEPAAPAGGKTGSFSTDHVIVPADGESGSFAVDHVIAPAADGSVKVYPAHAIATQCREYLNAAAAGVAVAAEGDGDEPDSAHERGSATGNGALAGKPAACGAATAPTTLVFVGAGDIDALARTIAGDCALRERWQQRLGQHTQIRLAEPLARRTTMRLGGSARLYADPGSAEDTGMLIQLAREAGLPVWLLGRGSNLIVPDEGFNGLVISFNSEAFRQIEPQADGTWYVGSGVALKRLCAQAARAGLSGWEFLDGIPGTVGGALRMNAGAMGKWMFDVVAAVDILLPDGSIERRPREAFHVGYRKCAELADGGVALGALLRPEVEVTVDAVRRTLDNYASRRKETQPREPSAGCIFKNPQGHHAGALIDELGLKGRRVGGAEVSAVHGNFIINRGEATAADVLELVRQIRAHVYAQRGIELEPEALLMGVDWKDVL